MTDRTISLLVTLDKEYRTDDAEVIVNAINMIKGVMAVDATILTSSDQMNSHSMKQHLKKQFFDAFIQLLDKM